MNEKDKKPSHYTTGENGEVVPVYLENSESQEEAIPENDSSPLYYVTEPNGEVKPVGVNTETETEVAVTSESLEQSSSLEEKSVQSESTIELSDEQEQALDETLAEETDIDTKEESTKEDPEIDLKQTEDIVSTNTEDKALTETDSTKNEEAKLTESDKKVDEEEPETKTEDSDTETANKPTEEDLQKVDLELDQETENTSQESQEVISATKVVDIKEKSIRGKSILKPWQKLGAGIAAFAAVGGAIFGASKAIDSDSNSAKSVSVQVENLSPEQKQALEQEGKKIISDLDALAEVSLQNIDKSDKAQWDEAFSIATTNPEQAGKILTDASVSKQLIDLAVALNEGVWTENYKTVMEKILLQASNKEIKLDTTASDVKDFLIKTGVWNYLPEKCTLQTTTIDTMFQTLNSTGDFAFGSQGNAWVKQYLIDLQQTNINTSSYHIETGLLTQQEVNSLIKGSQQYIDNANAKFDQIMQ